MRARNSYLLAALSGILLLLSLPPFKFGGFLAWVALVPLLAAVYYQEQPKRIGRLAAIVGLAAFPLVIWFAWWFPEIFSLVKFAWPQAPMVVFWWLGFLIGLVTAFYIARDEIGGRFRTYWKPKHFPSGKLQYLPPVLAILTLPLIWTFIEFVLLNIPGLMRLTGIYGFWSIAKTQWANPLVLWLASFTGMYGLTFLVLLVNCAVTYTIIHYRETKQISKLAIAVFCVFVFALVYGLVKVPATNEGDVTIAVIQAPVVEGQDANMLYNNLSEEALKYDPQVIIWPALVFEGLTPDESFARGYGTYFVGSLGDPPKDWGYGVLSPDGSTVVDNLGYHLFTVGRDIMALDAKSLFSPQVHSLKTGIGEIGVVDCIESGSTLPTLKRVRNGARLLVVPTGSPNAYTFSWVLGTNAVYRAAEHGVFAVEVIGDRNASMIIDPYGRVVDDTAAEPEIVVGKISFTRQRTFYTKYGDIFGWSIVGLALAFIGYNSYLRRKSPFKYCIDGDKCRAQLEKSAEMCPECGKSQKKSLWKRLRDFILYQLKH